MSHQELVDQARAFDLDGGHGAEVEVRQVIRIRGHLIYGPWIAVDPDMVNGDWYAKSVSTEAARDSLRSLCNHEPETRPRSTTTKRR